MSTTIDPNLTLLVVAVLNCVTAFFAWRTHLSTKANTLAMVTLESNTNSIKDALVKATGEAAFAAGETKARDEGIAEAKSLLRESKNERS